MTTEEKQRELDELGKKVLTGMKRAIRKLVETSAANNRELVIGDKDGSIRSIPAKELLKNLAN